MMMFMPISWLFFQYSIVIFTFSYRLVRAHRSRSYPPSSEQPSPHHSSAYVAYMPSGHRLFLHHLRFVLLCLIFLCNFLFTLALTTHATRWMPSSISFFLSRAQLFLLHTHSVSQLLIYGCRSHVTHALRSACVCCAREPTKTE